MFEIFEHTADIGIRARAGTLEELFVDAARGLFSIMVANPETIRPLQEITVSIAGEQHDDLLFDWLAELLYTFDTKRMVFREFEVKCTGVGVTAVIRGEPIDRARHELDMEVKAITYHGLKCEPDGDGWLAEVIVDL
jgi:SHS2 domain-containing protein